MAIVDVIDAALPQTQCGECGYPGCRPYAIALAQGTAPIDRCPPGGVETMNALALILERNIPSSVTLQTRPPSLAVIREAECIGCTKCIQACPVDAIIGTAKHMHNIINHECTGCGLCVEPCPVDCIEMHPIPAATYNKNLARQRFNTRKIRLLREEQAKETLYQQKRLAASQTIDKQQEKKAKQDYILNAIARVQAKKPHE